MQSLRFRRLSHTADVRLLIWGEDERELYANALLGAQTVAFGRSRSGRSHRWLKVSGMPDEPALRLVRVVNEGLFALYTLHLVVTNIRLAQSTIYLGVRPIREGEILETEIKAATLHDLRVHQRKGRWQAMITLDL
jgi:SHS2 domain-containing protein